MRWCILRKIRTIWIGFMKCLMQSHKIKCPPRIHRSTQIGDQGAKKLDRFCPGLLSQHITFYDMLSQKNLCFINILEEESKKLSQFFQRTRLKRILVVLCLQIKLSYVHLSREIRLQSQTTRAQLAVKKFHFLSVKEAT